MAYLDENGLEYVLDKLSTEFDKKSNTGHTHDDRYYTESEVDSKLADKADSDHTHTIDSSLSSTSTNPVQNKVVNSALSGKVPTTRTVNGKALSSNITLSASDVGADSAGSASSALASAKTYADSAASSAATTVKNDLLNGAGAAYDTLKELGDLISANDTAIDALETVAAGKADKSHTHSNYASTVTTTGSGNAITSISQSGNTITATKGATFLTSLPSHNHDDMYYTESEIDSKISTLNTAISGKAASSHTHDDRYYTESEIDSKVSTLNTAISRKMDDFSIEIYNGTGGNPKPVRFATFNYSTCDSENGIAARISLVSGHGNGTSYAFLEDAIIRVTFSGSVEVDNFKYYGQDCGTYDGEARQYGDIFWVVDTTNKVVDFYVLMGQYARVQQTPWKRLTYSSKGTVTQYNSCTVYSSGTKVYANNSEIATKSDIPEEQDLSVYAKKATTLSGYGITDAYTKTQVDTTVASLQSSIDGKAASSHSHSAATTSAAGFMSATDKAKLDGIAAGANAYSHPTTSGNKHIPSGGSSGQILRWSADGTAAWGADNNTTYSAGTGISLSGTTFSNSGVRSITSGSTNGTISVNTNGTSAEIAVKGLGSAAYTNSSTYATSGHTHNYAGSSSAGGSATSAVKLDTSTAGSATQPVYFSGGKPVACTYTLSKSVPSDAKFTDTTYSAISTSYINGMFNELTLPGPM